MKKTIYLDNAATSHPKPDKVYETLGSFLKEKGANPGRSGHRMAIAAEHSIDDARRILTRFFGGDDPERLVFTLNTTDALNIGIKGILEKGDHVITTLLEHNSVSRPLVRLKKDGFITLTQISPSPEGFVHPQDILKAIKPSTRLVVVTHASNVIGTIQPVAEIGALLKDKDCFFMVDAAQTAGVIPIDVKAMHIDLLAFPGHKSLLGPTGTGGLYVGSKVELRHWREGGTGGDSTLPTHPLELPFRLEGGTPNTVGIAALTAGVRFIKETGISTIRDHERKLLHQLIDGLKKNPKIKLYGSLDESRHVAALALNIDGISPHEAGTILDQSYGIAVRCGLHCAPYLHKEIGAFPEGAVRISPGYFNTASDIKTVVSALHEISHSS